MGREFLSSTLDNDYRENWLEAAIVLGEVAAPEAAQLLMTTLRDVEQDPEIRAGAAWALGEVGTRAALPVLIESFSLLQTTISVEAARALAKIARQHLHDVVRALPSSTNG